MPLHSPTACRPAGRRRGFTLVELVLASALAAILLVGLQSAVMIASKAIPKTTGVIDTAAQGAALDRIALDLSYAKVITSSSATAITFTVADRDSDGAEDTISYSWSGTAKDPLLRQFNSLAAETILAEVSSFSLTLQSEVVTGVQTYIDSSETLLASYSSASNIAQWSIDATTWACQSILVTVPAGAIDYRTTRLRLAMAKASASTGTTAAEMRTFRRDQPTSAVLANASIDETSLPGSVTPISISFPSVRYMDPTEPTCLVIRPTANPASGQFSYRTSGAAATAGAWYVSANSGGTWTTTAGRAVIYELYGVYRTIDSTPSLTRATFARLKLQSGTNTALELNLPLANRPQAAS